MVERPIETRDRAADARKHPIEIDVKRARGARQGIPVLYMLISGLILVIVAFLIIYFVIEPRGMFAAHMVSSGSSAI